ncbi:MAG: hypothetical protein D6683_08900 [Actinomyces sp.]|nr:MAG: hypothetical protein D6683_08900 [Actinomyces sp.]
MEALPDGELECVEGAVVHALDTNDHRGLTILGYGEVSVAIGWPTGAPRWALKRLPPFPDRAARRRHIELIRRYIDHLTAAGVGVVDTEIATLERDDGALLAYLVQPALDPATLAPAVLAAADPAHGHPLVDAVVDAVLACTDGRCGIDAQMTNWVWSDGRVSNLDVNTPFLYDAEGRPELDVGVFLAALPAPVRRAQRRATAGIVARWRRPRWALLDCAMNLYKDGLDAWVPLVIAAANPHLDEPLDPDEVARRYESEAKLWVTMHRLERLERWWRRRIRRQRYEFLLSPDTHYARRRHVRPTSHPGGSA